MDTVFHFDIFFFHVLCFIFLVKPKISKSDEVKHVNKEESVDIDCKFTGEEVDVFWQHNSETYKVLDGEDETPQVLIDRSIDWLIS